MSTITGTIIKMGPVEEFESGFTKKAILLETGGRYPQKIKIEFHKDRADLLASYKKGDLVEVAYDLKGNEYNSKHYVQVVGWKIQGQQQEQQAPPTPPHAPKSEKPTASDDLPF